MGVFALVAATLCGPAAHAQASGLLREGSKLIASCRTASRLEGLGLALKEAGGLAKDAERIGVFMDAEVDEDGRLLQYSLDERWVAPLLDRGANPILIPPTGRLVTLHAQADQLNGFFLVGSDLDLAPEAWGDDPHHLLGPTLETKTTMELAAVQLARRDGKPLLGICNGMQAMNAAYGGTFWFDLFTQRGVDHVGPKGGEACHSVTLFPGTPHYQFVGGPFLDVNSIHHMAVRKPGAGLAVGAVADDGTIEGIYDPAHPFAVGVQWHPEWMMETPASQALFDAFVAASREHPTQPPPMTNR